MSLFLNLADPLVPRLRRLVLCGSDELTDHYLTTSELLCLRLGVELQKPFISQHLVDLSHGVRPP